MTTANEANRIIGETMTALEKAKKLLQDAGANSPSVLDRLTKPTERIRDALEKEITELERIIFPSP